MFDLVDKNSDGVISYRELLQAVQLDEVKTFIGERERLQPLLYPKKMRATMKKIAASSEDQELNVQAFIDFARAL